MDPEPGDDDRTPEQGTPPDGSVDSDHDSGEVGPAAGNPQPDRFLDGYVPI